MRFVDVFEGLNKRKPTTEEKLKFERLVATLETTPNDAMLSVLVAFEHYKTLYETIPNKINGAVTDTLKSVNEAAKKQAELAVAETQKDLAKAVAEASQKVAKSVAHRQTAQWVLLTATGVFAILIFTIIISFDLGSEKGYAEGYAKARDEKAMASWANTQQGQQAYKLAQNGSLDKLVNCTGKGWQIEKKMCFPYGVEGEGTYGWQIR